MKIFSWIKKLNSCIKTQLDLTSPKKESKRLIEKKLLKKLKVLGYILLAFSLVCLVYGGIHACSHPEHISTLEELSSAMDDDLPAHEVLNFFMISMIFFFFGMGCIFFTKVHYRRHDK